MEKLISAAMQCGSSCQLYALIIVCFTLVAIFGILCLVAFKLLNTLNAFYKVSANVSHDSVKVELKQN